MGKQSSGKRAVVSDEIGVQERWMKGMGRLMIDDIVSILYKYLGLLMEKKTNMYNISSLRIGVFYGMNIETVLYLYNERVTLWT